MESKYKMDVREIDVNLVAKWEDNPNAMTDAEFNALCEELDQHGLIDPIQVVGPQENGQFLILGGHHRYDAARVLGWEKIACVVLPASEWSGEKVEFQNIKMNVLKGSLKPEKMIKWYKEKASKYNAETLASLTGFVDMEVFLKIVGEFKKAIKDTGLPDELQDKLAETMAEAKSVDDLSNILNKIFSEYGDTLKYGFMVFTYGNQEHVYIKCTKKTWDLVTELRKQCVEGQVDINLVFEDLLAGKSVQDTSVTPDQKFDEPVSEEQPEKKKKTKKE